MWWSTLLRTERRGRRQRLVRQVASQSARPSARPLAGQLAGQLARRLFRRLARQWARQWVPRSVHPLLLAAALLGTAAAPAASAPAAQPVQARAATGSTHLAAPGAVPAVSGYDVDGCARPGEPLGVHGSGFGATQGSRVVSLHGGAAPLTPEVLRWSERLLVLRLPSAPPLRAAASYRVVVQSAGAAAADGASAPGFRTCPEARNGRFVAPTRGPDDDVPSGAVAQRGRDEAGPPGASGWPEPPPAAAGWTAPAGPVGVLPPPPPPAAATVGRGDAEPGELAVISPDVEAAQALAELAAGLGYGVKSRRILRGLGLVMTVLRLPQDTAAAQALGRLRDADPQLWADLNHRYRALAAPRRYARTLIGRSDVACDAAVAVGQIDSPVDSAHPDLAGAHIEQRSFLSRGRAPAAADHGTAVAGVLLGAPGDGAGAARGTLYAASVFADQPDGVHATATRLLRALDWLVGQPVEVINMSLGGPHNLLLEAALVRTLGLGRSVVAAAGPADAGWPAAQPGVLSVAAVDARARLAGGERPAAPADIAAPGVDLWLPRPGGGHAYRSGSSFAAPWVSAALAQLRRTLSREAAHARLLETLQPAPDDAAPGVMRWPADCGRD